MDRVLDDWPVLIRELNARDDRSETRGVCVNQVENTDDSNGADYKEDESPQHVGERFEPEVA